LTGRYTSLDDFVEGDGRRFLPRFSVENFPKNLALVTDLIAKKKGRLPGQLTLAWLTAQERVSESLDIEPVWIPLPMNLSSLSQLPNLSHLFSSQTNPQSAKIFSKFLTLVVPGGGKIPSPHSAEHRNQGSRD
jgi:aryl-alcohol dehydrogenase-like predicted oxidoreductase